MESKKSVLFPEDISNETGLGSNIIYRYLRAGKIPGAIRVGDRWMLSRSNFEKWINGESQAVKNAC